MKDNILEYIRTIIKEELENYISSEFEEKKECDELEEASTSTDAGAYNTKYAFQGPGDEEKKKRDLEKGGMTVVRKTMPKTYGVPLKSTPKLTSEGYYHEYKKDESLSPRQKVGLAIREINRALNEIQRFMEYNIRLKTETGLSPNEYWKRTQLALERLNEKLSTIQKYTKELKK